jgi:hypothetical protein
LEKNLKNKRCAMKNTKQKEVEALCKECGHAFKSYMDRVLHDEKSHKENKILECPVCGCGDCKIGQ